MRVSLRRRKDGLLGDLFEVCRMAVSQPRWRGAVHSTSAVRLTACYVTSLKSGQYRSHGMVNRACDERCRVDVTLHVTLKAEQAVQGARYGHGGRPGTGSDSLSAHWHDQTHPLLFDEVSTLEADSSIPS